MRNAAGMELRGERDLVEAMAATLRAGENWLLTRVMDLARRHRHPWPVSPSELGWPLSVRLLCAALVERWRIQDCERDDESGTEPAGVTDFIQALAFCRRGEDVDLPLFLELVKLYRRAFTGFFRRALFDEELRLDAMTLLDEAFDDLETSVCREWKRAEFDGRRRAWQAVNRRLAGEKRRYETVFAQLRLPVFFLGPDGRLQDANRAGLEFLEAEERSASAERGTEDGGLADGLRICAGETETASGLNWLGEDIEEFRRNGGTSHRLERILNGPDGPRAFAVSLHAVDGEAGRDGLAVILEEITEAGRKERELENALRQRDVLLREVHHRVKNNMQIISSLISLQAQQTVSEEAAAAFLKSQLRIRAMAAAHESMYRSGGSDKICLGRYLRDILCMVAQVFKKQPPVIHVVNQVDGAYVDMDAAVPCGLIVGELAANSFKHAFKGRREGEIRVSLTRTGSRFALIVEDNGVGLSPEALSSGSLGLELVRALVEQLYGRMTVSGEGGARFAIEFTSPVGGPEGEASPAA